LCPNKPYPTKKIGKTFCGQKKPIPFPSVKMILPRITRSLVGQRALSTRCLHLHAFRIVSTQVFSLPGAAKTVTGSCFQQTRRESTDVQIPHWIQPGDWVCGNCHGHNFRSRTLCFTCQDPNLKGRTFYRKGDWCCPKCEIQVPGHYPPPSHKFAYSVGRNDHCIKCLTEKDSEYEYPLSNRDFGMDYPGEII
jgi:hypothetical protein